MRLTFCAACGGRASLDHHHLVPRSQGGSDDETNLITLCRSCHGKVHGVEWSNNLSDMIKEGMKRARATGRTFGRPPIGPAREAEVQRLLAEGIGMVKVGKIVGCGTATVQRIKKEITSR